MKNICLTFDYELFFGDSGTVEACLLNPTSEILKVLRCNGQKATFFIDVLFLERLEGIREEDANYKRIIDQLLYLIDSGHRIELHLHPHWRDAKYFSGQWIFPHYNHYTLQSLPEPDVTDLFVRGTQLLEGVARQVDSSYKVVAFRAGGWGVQPFEKLKRGFIKTGIKIDTSVMPGLRDWGGIQAFDFSQAPDLPFWRFSDDPCIADDQGSLWELPISVYKKSLSDRLSHYIHRRVWKDVPFGDGTGVLSANKPVASLLSRLMSPRLSLLSTDDVDINGILRFVQSSTKELFLFINHPKVMLRKSGLQNLDRCGIFNAVLINDVIEKNDNH